MDYKELLRTYNPWWVAGAEALSDLPAFERPAIDFLLQEVETLPQILSLTGPRRVGKTTMIRQVIRHLLQQGVASHRLVYYSLDDPAMFRPGTDAGQLLDSLITALLEDRRERGEAGRIYLFLDEVQRLDHWELYLKKYYDLSYPVRLVISGSAASPIFRKSRESLMGRVKDHHLPPFSFREFMLYQWKEYPSLIREMREMYAAGVPLDDSGAWDPNGRMLPLLSQLWEAAQISMPEYLREGGFPEVWSLATFDQKMDYLYDNQIKKVIYEDLVLAAEFRKPEQIKRFYLSLLERPGSEISFSSIAQETGVDLQQVEKYVPLLELTGLVTRVEKFRKSPLRVRRGRGKMYLMDLALRNAVLRLQGNLDDPAMMGLYAENLVHNGLRKWRRTLALDYYRERNDEVNFIVHLGPSTYLPVEVKYRESVTAADLAPVRRFTARFHTTTPLIITKRLEDFGPRPYGFCLPLYHFLLLFD